MSLLADRRKRRPYGLQDGEDGKPGNAAIIRNGRERKIPTSRSVGANTWHFLLSRRNEVGAFSTRPSVEVIQRDIQRASALKRASDVARLGHLAAELQSA